MRTLLTWCFSAFFVAFVAATFIGFAQTQHNPPCYHDQTPLAGHGTKDGRRIINVYLDPSVTNDNTKAGAQKAFDQWNNTKETAALGGQEGRQSPYYFQFTSNKDEADIKIEGGSPNGGCGDNNIATTGAHRIRIASTVVNNPVDLISGLVAHELGHSIGISNGCCYNNPPSIMSGYTGACDTATDAVTPNDITAVNRNFNPDTRVNCTETKTSGRADPDIICEDADGDGVCADTDCNDFDASVAYGCNSGGGGGGYYDEEPCTHYDWVYYESYDGGKTWHEVDREYAGCF